MSQPMLQDVCEEIIDDVNGVLGCALVDILTGLPLAMDVKSGSPLNGSAMEMISAAGAAYFRDNLTMEAGGDDPALQGDYVQEVQATTTDTYNFMSLVPNEKQELLILIADRKNSNLGLGWMAMREALDLVRKANDDDQDAESVDVEATVLPSHHGATPRTVQRRLGQSAQRARRRRAIWGER